MLEMKDRYAALMHKIVSVDEAKKRLEIWRLTPRQIVFTNGCFDILHKGHISYLAKAASLGNRLVIGLNSDASVKAQGKGEDRPVNAEMDRAAVLAALGFVDLIILFDEDTPINLINELNPHILAKGADYDAEETDETAKTYIVGSKEVRANGGSVETIELEEGYSTTALIEKLRG